MWCGPAGCANKLVANGKPQAGTKSISGRISALAIHALTRERIEWLDAIIPYPKETVHRLWVLIDIDGE